MSYPKYSYLWLMVKKIDRILPINTVISNQNKQTNNETMSTTLKQKPTFAELKTILDEIVDPKGSDMRLILEALAANPHLVKFFFRVPRVESDGPTKSRKTGFAKPVDEADMCTAMVWNMVEDQDGNLVPKRCFKSKKDDGLFCTQHGAKIPEEKQKCNTCSLRDTSNVIHKFKWEHLGTIDEPSSMFKTNRTDLETIYKKKQGISIPSKVRGRKSKKVESDSEEEAPKKKKKSKKVESDSEEEAPKKKKKKSKKAESDSEEEAPKKKKKSKKAESDSEEEAPKKKVESDSEEEATQYTYNTTHDVFIDPDTNITYKNKGSVDEPEVDDETPIGQFKSDGSLTIFKKK
jgi:hypothetical protein